MAEGSVNVTEGSGKRLHVWDRTISSTLVHDQFMLPGEYPYASYVAYSGSISTSTANSHLLQVMAGSSTYVRIRRIRLEQNANATTASLGSFSVFRVTTAGTGGTSVTPDKFDNGDSAASATAMTLPSAKGTEAANPMWSFVTVMRQAFLATATQPEETYEWTQQPNQKPLIIPAGTANGIVIKCNTGIAGSTVLVQVEFVETAWLGA